MTIKYKDKGLHFQDIFYYATPFPCTLATPVSLLFLEHIKYVSTHIFALAVSFGYTAFPQDIHRLAFILFRSLCKCHLFREDFLDHLIWVATPLPAMLAIFLLHLLFFFELCTTWSYIVYLFVYFCSFQWNVSFQEPGILFYFSAVPEAFRTLWT